MRQRMAKQWLSLGQMVRLLDIESVSPHGYYIVEREQAPLNPEARYSSTGCGPRLVEPGPAAPSCLCLGTAAGGAPRHERN